MKRSLLFFAAVGVACLLSACGGTGSITGFKQAVTTHFPLSAPQDATADAAFNFTVTALDASNNTVPTYSGTVHFTTTDNQTMPPADSALTSGTGVFPAIFTTSGEQTITATDTVAATVTGKSEAAGWAQQAFGDSQQRFLS